MITVIFMIDMMMIMMLIFTIQVKDLEALLTKDTDYIDLNQFPDHAYYNEVTLHHHPDLETHLKNPIVALKHYENKSGITLMIILLTKHPKVSLSGERVWGKPSRGIKKKIYILCVVRFNNLMLRTTVCEIDQPLVLWGLPLISCDTWQSVILYCFQFINSLEQYLHCACSHSQNFESRWW